MAIVLLQCGGVVNTAILSLVPAAEAWLSMAIKSRLAAAWPYMYKLSISRHVATHHEAELVSSRRQLASGVNIDKLPPSPREKRALDTEPKHPCVFQSQTRGPMRSPPLAQCLAR
ncbi:hypothetical protein BBK36DRAFT_1139080 [Trichoderma citrinoviride]|uniref:Uncharacterized protein n=1 Tax=Trichoderma citrinoviride TaxID=58853 RepID=A0A2T4BI44_9HYPO|nr:hypothetical protein BBK36DRAFT_1139080 [Trichoderma citrinoviride]PTB68992.1 hypothetical protein BBK36DRAFT_1139080 [Trichoderma citrinoviride]